MRYSEARERPRARHAEAVGQAHQTAFLLHQLLVDRVQLLDEQLDTRVVECQRLDVDDDFVTHLFVGLLLLARDLLALHLRFDALLLQLAQFLVRVGDALKGFEDLWLQLGLHGRER